MIVCSIVIETIRLGRYLSSDDDLKINVVGLNGMNCLIEGIDKAEKYARLQRRNDTYHTSFRRRGVQLLREAVQVVVVNARFGAETARISLPRIKQIAYEKCLCSDDLGVPVDPALEMQTFKILIRGFQLFHYSSVH
tara:strand:- start:4325 stop:4735 length:411 start_codon:yes stop_codon:yes gene_type:complete